ncbi:diguanylate cyclase [Marinithermus hydrothermalis]|uniref:GGDEF domain containing protein n=1 Tax=Marinithermus hydrothermalis (strain DSM 14884 / JCM 11576 / T1) TaxID=869210 RepID=F2NL25_MARHT|nr:diguanylate cyclase [Marinithermus hydrothermalis]AEB11428.1 GGDEF domain containing protein [Marinithermus hydrothermalis DSM 14884]
MKPRRLLVGLILSGYLIGFLALSREPWIATGLLGLGGALLWAVYRPYPRAWGTVALLGGLALLVLYLTPPPPPVLAGIGLLACTLGALSLALPLQAETSLERCWTRLVQEAELKGFPIALAIFHTPRSLRAREERLLRRHLRRRDLLLPLQAGFAVLLWKADTYGSAVVAEKLRHLIAEHLGIPAWAGIAVYPDHGHSLDALWTQAETALNAARKHPTPTVQLVLPPSIHEVLHALQPDWLELQRAAETEHAPLALLYLPTQRAPQPLEVQLARKELRPKDRVAATAEGFLILLWKADAHGARVVAQTLQNALGPTLPLAAPPRYAVFPQDGTSLPSLWQNAHSA